MAKAWLLHSHAPVKQRRFRVLDIDTVWKNCGQLATLDDILVILICNDIPLL